MGLNMTLIEDIRVKKYPTQLSKNSDPSDQHALSTPSFAVTQALVGLLAQTGGVGLHPAPANADPTKGKVISLVTGG